MCGTRIRWEVGMRWQLTAFAIAVVLAGCATPDPYTNDLLTASIAPGTGRKSIGVISAIGDAFSPGHTLVNKENKKLLLR